MSLRRKAISAFIVWHMLAVALASLPPRERPASFLWPLSASYVGLTGLHQRWGMFSNPPRDDRYVRIRYYIQPARGRLWTASELLMPAHREDRVRLVRSFRDSYQDKALEIMLEDFYRRRKPAAVRPDTRPEELPNDLVPIVRFFARRYAARALSGTDQRIVRAEVWVGSAANPAPGATPDAALGARRLVVLQTYYDGPVERRLAVPGYPPYHGVEQEADIQWVLEYYEEP